jgi:hypothetical protein
VQRQGLLPRGEANPEACDHPSSTALCSTESTQVTSCAQCQAVVIIITENLVYSTILDSVSLRPGHVNSTPLKISDQQDQPALWAHCLARYYRALAPRLAGRGRVP